MIPQTKIPQQAVIQYPYSAKYTTYSIIAYFAGLLGVAILASSTNMVMEWQWWAFGLVEVLGFYFAAQNLSKNWMRYKPKVFEKRLFGIGFAIRAVVVLFLYWFFNEMKGDHLMFNAGDEIFYIDVAEFGASRMRDGYWGTFFQDMIQYSGGFLGISDMGYPTWLSFVYFLTDNSLLLSRIIKAALSAYTCVLIYRLATRNFGELVGRMSAIFCMLMPNLIYYCGISLKETEMLFLVILFLDSSDKLLRQKRFAVRIYILPLVTALLLFTFRNVLGAAAIMSLGVALFLSSEKAARLSRRWVVLILLLIMGTYFMGGKIAMELEQNWEQRNTSQSERLEERARAGNVLATKASAAVFAPLIFTIPFPTMIETADQETFRMLHGGVVVKNIMSGFTIFAIIMLILEGSTKLRAKWRDHVLLLAMLAGYLVILTFSPFAHAERFHLPAIPLEMILAAYGISKLKPSRRYLFVIWCIVMVVAMIAWNWFKLKGRGMV